MPELKIKLPDFKKLSLNKLGSYKGDVILLLIGILLWWWRMPILRQLDESVGHIYSEFLGSYFYAILGTIVAHITVKVVMWVGWGVLDRHLESEFKQLYQNLSPWQKILCSLFVFALYLLVFVLLATGM
jgi:hypothetical protein